MFKKTTATLLVLFVLIFAVALTAVAARAERNILDIDFDAHTLDELRAIQTLVVAAIQRKEAQMKMNATPKSQRPTATPDGAIRVSFKRLFEDYEKNEIAADSKYKNNILEITGEITSIDKGLFGDVYIVLAEDDRMFNLDKVMAYIREDQYDKVIRIEKGQTITVRGKCSGRSFTSVSLQECILP